MSWKLVQQVLTTKHPRWETPTQQSVLVVLAQYYNERFRYAYLSKRKLGTRAGGIGPRRVHNVILELEGLGVAGRLPHLIGRGAVNRYIVVPEAFERDATFANLWQPMLPEAVENAVEDSAVTGRPLEAECQPPWNQRSTPPGSIDPAPLEAECTHIKNDLYKERSSIEGSDSSTGTAPAAAQPRLAALLSEIQRHRHTQLATEPAADGNWRAVVRAVEDVVGDRELAGRLVKGYDPEKPSDLVEAVKRLCARRHIDVGRHEDVAADVVYRAVEWVTVRRAIASGDPRPRDAKQSVR